MSTDTPPSGGTRRIDRVLAEDYLSGLSSAPLEDVRALRGEAEQEEVDLSYIRRIMQGRLDVLRAELDRRGGRRRAATWSRTSPGSSPTSRAARPTGWAGTPRSSRAGSTATAATSRRWWPTSTVSDVGARTPEDLAHAMRVLSEEEQGLSGKRRDVQAVMDACSAEITRRYRDGEADVDDLLPS